MSRDDLCWVSANRDFAETERFVAKPEVDSGLVESPNTVRESARIRELFASPDYADAIERYVERLDEVMFNVHYALLAGATSASTWTYPDVRVYWRDFAQVSGLDNAHAMHLSSGDWGFNVIEPANDFLSSWTPDAATRNVLLTGGILDARTFVPLHLPRSSSGVTRDEFVDECVARGPVLPHGVVSVVCYETAKVSGRVLGVLREREAAIAADFDELGERLRTVAGPIGVRYHALVGQVHRLRRLYDIFEYFGVYAFLRHVVLRKISPVVADARSEEVAERFLRYATLYQYELALRVLEDADR